MSYLLDLGDRINIDRFIHRHTEPDGNCFFHTILYLLFKGVEDVKAEKIKGINKTIRNIRKFLGDTIERLLNDNKLDILDFKNILETLRNNMNEEEREKMDNDYTTLDEYINIYKRVVSETNSLMTTDEIQILFENHPIYKNHRIQIYCKNEDTYTVIFIINPEIENENDIIHILYTNTYGTEDYENCAETMLYGNGSYIHYEILEPIEQHHREQYREFKTDDEEQKQDYIGDLRRELNQLENNKKELLSKTNLGGQQKQINDISIISIDERIRKIDEELIKLGVYGKKYYSKYIKYKNKYLKLKKQNNL